MLRLVSSLAFLFLSVVFPTFADKVPISPSPYVDPPSVCDAIAGNLVANCGFETGTFVGSWTVSNNDGNTVVAGAGFDEGPNSGNYFAAFGTVGGDATIQQTLTTVPGETYAISFYFASDGETPNDFSALFNGDLLYSNLDTSAFGYTKFTFTDTATSTSTLLQFNGRSDPGFQALDDISVIATPEPASTPLLLAVAGLFAVALRKHRSQNLPD
jgi:PEP-CTERM motif